MAGIDAARRRYAELVRELGSIGSTRPFSPRLFAAFAEVPRERYLGKGPWKILRPSDPWTKIETPDDDPERLYDNVLVSIIADKGLANGLPSGHARWLNALDLEPSDRVLHCGCGTGYYTAIIAHVVGNSGHVTAIELEQSLASLAEQNLRHLSHVEVIAGNATTYDAGKVNAIYVNAGATHPMPLWLDSLMLGGRLIFPLVRYPRGGESWIVNARAGNRDFETAWVSCCASSGPQQVMLLPLFRLRSSSHVLVRLIPIRKQIECWGKLYDPAQSLKRTHCGANRMIVMRHASCTFRSIASRNSSRIDGGSGGSHAALTRSAGAARTYSEQEVGLRT